MAFKDQYGNEYSSRTDYYKDVYAAEKAYNDLAKADIKATEKERKKANNKALAKGLVATTILTIAPLAIVEGYSAFHDWRSARRQKKLKRDQDLIKDSEL